MKFSTEDACESAGNLWLSANDLCIVTSDLDYSQSNLVLNPEVQTTAKNIELSDPPVIKDSTPYFWLFSVFLFLFLIFYFYKNAQRS